jgi:hypothetical protein
MKRFRRKRSEATAGGPQSIGLALAMKRKGTPVTYLAGANGAFQAVRERVDAALTITYDEDERRLPVPEPVSYHQAFRILRQETGQAMAVINASRETGAIYGIEEGKAGTFASRALPLTYLVDLALKGDARGRDGKPLLVAIFFGEVEKAGAPLLVIGVNADRSMVLQDLVPNVADFSTTITNMLGAMVSSNAWRGLDFDPRQASRNEEVRRLEQAFQEERLLLCSVVDLAQLTQDAKGYPREPVYRGISQSALSRAALAAGLLALASSAGFAAVADGLRRAAQKEAEAIERGLEERRHEVRARLLDRVSGLGARMTLDHAALFEAAQSLWQPGTKVILAATLAASRLTLIVPNVRERLPAGLDRRTASAARGAETILGELRLVAPQGWSRSAIETSGDFNAWAVSFTSAPVERDLLDLVGAGGAAGQAAVDTVPAGGRGASGGAGALPVARP